MQKDHYRDYMNIGAQVILGDFSGLEYFEPPEKAYHLARNEYFSDKPDLKPCDC